MNAITKSAGDGLANNGLFTHASGSHASSTAIGGTERHCCSHLQIGDSALPGSPTISNGNASEETTSTTENFQSLRGFASQPVGFDSFVDNSFDSAFPSAKNASLVLAGGGDSGMSVGSQTSASAAALGTGSGTSSGNAGVSGGFTATATGSFALAAPSQSGPMILLPSTPKSAAIVAGIQKGSPPSPSISPALGSSPDAVMCFDPVCLLGLRVYTRQCGRR